MGKRRIHSEIYSSTVKQNCSWSHTAVGLTELVHFRKSRTGLEEFGRPQSSPKKSCRPGKLGCEASWLLRHSGLDLAGWSHYGGQAARMPEVRRSSRRRQGQREVTQGSTGSEHTSIIISDDDSQRDSAGGVRDSYSIRMMEEESCLDDTLWVLDNGESQEGEPEVRLSDDHRLRHTADDMDDSNDSLSCWSIESGPTLVGPAAPCAHCTKLFTKMRRVKGWKKVIDYDPTSLSCDQWVLKKRWQPRRAPNMKGRLWAHLRRLNERSSVGCRPGLRARMRCSRPHVFLQRNLTRCKRAAPVQSGARIVSAPEGKDRRKRQRKRRRKQDHAEVSVVEQSDLCPRAPPCAASPRHIPSIRVRAGTSDAERKGDWSGAWRALTFEPDRLDSDSPECGGELQAQNMTFPSAGSHDCVQRTTSVRGPAGQFSWVQRGGFRSLLSEFSSRRSTVVKELQDVVL